MNEKIIINGTVEKELALGIPAFFLAIGIISFICFLNAPSINAENVYITIGIVFTLAAIFLFFYLSKGCEINVTSKSVFGKAVFGRRVDLPLDSITAVGTGILKTISVSSSSGRIAFSCIHNYEEVRKEINKLLLARQDTASKPVTIKQEIPQSNADELKKYKDLLDAGVISQEEFEAKKKQLLGL